MTSLANAQVTSNPDFRLTSSDSSASHLACNHRTTCSSTFLATMKLLVPVLLWIVDCEGLTSSPRRAFLQQLSVAIGTGTGGWVLLEENASAYERRDVGGAGRSPEQAAYNEQAYETNNRLERSGLKLETAQEQSASLTATLSEYSYSATPSKGTKDKNAKSSGQQK